jgi:CPA1 family monovalent cation:H+ antiporter
MELTLTSALALFTLISLSTVVFFLSKKIKIPYTVLLVLTGLLLVPVVHLPYLKNTFGFLDSMALTPELLFFIFLPVLIFESGFNMSIRKMLESAWTISFLSIVSLIVSVVTIAFIIYLTMPLVGFNIPLPVAFMFGAIISPTDPVAVLSLFKEYKAPRRLAMIFEGESLFNDGTAMALFMVLLAVAQKGFHGTETVLGGLLDFTVMLVVGILIGLLMAAIFSRALRYTKNNEFVTVTLLLISAHLVFIISELINHSGVIHVSSIIATTVSSLFLGNYSRNILAPKLDEYLSKVIEHLSFVVNSLVFLMAGLLFASTGINFLDLWVPILLTVLAVAFARVVAVYAVTRPLRWMGLEEPVPSSWEKLLAWASLRGALSIIIVLLIPENFSIKGWHYPYSPRDFLLALTIGCILTTLFVKAPLVGRIMRRYGISEPEPLKEAYKTDLAMYYALAKKKRLSEYAVLGILSTAAHERNLEYINKVIEILHQKRDQLVRSQGISILEQSLHFTMISVEKSILKRLFVNKELDERTYRRILSKLKLQIEKIESAEHDQINPHDYTDRKDIFDRLVSLIQLPFDRSSIELTPAQKLEYYRTQRIMARKAIEAADLMQHGQDDALFPKAVYDSVLDVYRSYMSGSLSKFEKICKDHPLIAQQHREHLALRSLFASGNRAMNYLHHRGLVNEETEEEIREIFHESFHSVRFS